MPIVEPASKTYLLVRQDGLDLLRVNEDGESYGDGETAASVFAAMEAEGFAEEDPPGTFTAGTGGDAGTGANAAAALADLAANGQALADAIDASGAIGVFITLAGSPHYFNEIETPVGQHYVSE